MPKEPIIPTLEEIQARGRERALLEAMGRDAAGGSMRLDGIGSLAGLRSHVEDDPETHFDGLTPEEIAAIPRVKLED
jgi:hypothetical protein